MRTNLIIMASQSHNITVGNDGTIAVNLPLLCSQYETLGKTDVS